MSDKLYLLAHSTNFWYARIHVAISNEDISTAICGKTLSSSYTFMTSSKDKTNSPKEFTEREFLMMPDGCSYCVRKLKSK